MTKKAQFFRYIQTDLGTVLSTNDVLGNPVQITLDDEHDAAIRRVFDDAVMLGAQTTPIPPVGLGTWEFDLTPYNLDPAYDYNVYFRMFDFASNRASVEAQLVGGNTDEDSRANLRRRVGRLMLGRDKFQFGPVTQATVNTVTANFARRMDNNWLSGRNLFVTNGQGSGQETFITGNNRGSGQMTVEPSWNVVPDQTSTVEVWGDRLSPEDVNDALNLAILDVARIHHRPITAQVTTISTDRRSIEIPPDYSYIFRVRWESAGRWWEAHTTSDEWTVSFRAGRCYFNQPLPSDATGVWLDGYRKPALLRNDSDVSEVPSAFVVYQAAYLLEASQAGGQQIDPEQHAGRAGNWLRAAAIARAEVGTKWMPNTAPVEAAL